MKMIIIKYLNLSNFTFTDVDNEIGVRLVCTCNSKRRCALCVNFKPSDSFRSSLTHGKYVIKRNDKNIIILNYSTSNCIYMITCCRCGLQYVGETVKSLRDRFSVVIGQV